MIIQDREHAGCQIIMTIGQDHIVQVIKVDPFLDHLKAILRQRYTHAAVIVRISNQSGISWTVNLCDNGRDARVSEDLEAHFGEMISQAMATPS